MRRNIVLILQEDADSREMYAEYFRYQGFDPIAVSTARHALTLASKVDAIVTGLLLPGHMDGMTLIERLKTDRKTRNVPLIVVTSCAWVTERARAERAGCDVFLSKPCLPDELTREVRRLLAAAMANGRRGSVRGARSRSRRSGSSRSRPSDSTCP
jgi:DNA-binding response OmpR family regulator